MTGEITENKPLLLKFLSFLLHPSTAIQSTKAISNLNGNKTNNRSIKQLFKQTFNFKQALPNFLSTVRLWTLQYLLAIMLGIILTFTLKVLDYEASNNAIDQALQNGAILYILIYGCLIGPIIEEITFRLGLKFSALTLSIGLSFFVFFTLQLMLGFLPTISQAISSFLFGISIWKGVTILITSFICIFFIFFSLFSRLISYQTGVQFFNKHIGLIFYTSVILFGFAHISNYSHLGYLIILTPIFVAPQLVIGLFLGFIRIQYGIVWAIFDHILHNLVTLAPLALLITIGGIELLTEPTLTNKILTEKPLLLIIFIILLGFFFILGFVLISTIQMVVESIIYLLYESQSR